MGLKLTLAFCFVAIFGINVECKRVEDFLRDGYSYIGSGGVLYKFHNIWRTWHEVKRKCEEEEATLFFPENEQEAKQVKDFYDQDGASWFIGITDSQVEGKFKTIDGRDIAAVHHKWYNGEPNNKEGMEDCVILWKQSSLKDVPCFWQYPFVCKKVITDPSMKQPHNMMEDTVKYVRRGYSYISSGDVLYKFHDVKKSWAEAKAQCEQEGTTLFVPENEHEAKQVRSFYDQAQVEWVIGLSDLITEGQFKTTDGRDVAEVYHTWNREEPNNGGEEEEDCVILWKDSLLNDVSCDLNYNFVCKKELNMMDDSVEQERDGYSYIGSRDVLYKYHNEKKSWARAKAHCEQEGATLFVPENEQEAKQVRAFYDHTEAEWVIGISDFITEGQFKTTDGRDIAEVYHKWDKGEPNNGGEEDCVILRKDFMLNDVPCDLKYKFACKKVLKELSVN